MDKIYNVLFLCTGNSARSILGEVLLNDLGKGRFRAYSAGSFPRGFVHPMALTLLQGLSLPTDDLRSKSWDEFAAPGAPQMDFIFTVCDQAAGEVCPVWPGHPVTAHWGMPDPAAARLSAHFQEGRAGFRPAARLSAHFQEGRAGLRPAATGTEMQQMAAFREAFRTLQNRIRIFVSLRHDALDRLALTKRVEEIGQAQAEPADQ